MIKFYASYDMNKMVKCTVCKKERRAGEFISSVTPKMCKYCWAERSARKNDR